MRRYAGRLVSGENHGDGLVVDGESPLKDSSMTYEVFPVVLVMHRDSSALGLGDELLYVGSRMEFLASLH